MKKKYRIVIVQHIDKNNKQLKTTYEIEVKFLNMWFNCKGYILLHNVVDEGHLLQHHNADHFIIVKGKLEFETLELATSYLKFLQLGKIRSYKHHSISIYACTITTQKVLEKVIDHFSKQNFYRDFISSHLNKQSQVYAYHLRSKRFVQNNIVENAVDISINHVDVEAKLNEKTITKIRKTHIFTN